MTRRLLPLLCLLTLLLSSVHLSASIDSFDFANEQQRERYQQLTEELRCPKCQNQNLADSDSQIAADLRRELYSQLMAGKSDEDILAFMQERYGDFVLYEPRFQRNTLLLWLGPLALLLGTVCWLLLSRRQASPAQKPLATASGEVAITRYETTADTEPRWINIVSLSVLIAIAAGSWLLYWQLGARQAIQLTELANQVFSADVPDSERSALQGDLLAGLDNWIASHPDDEKFLYMRARLLSETMDWAGAGRDYRALLSRFPDQDNLLAEYAQVLFLQANRTLTPDVTAFLKQALQANPHNATALGLLGMHAFEQQDYASAVGFWERLLRGIPAGSAEADAIASGIARARELGHLPSATAAEIRLAVPVTVTAEAGAKPDDTVFVFLRAVDGPRMPLAVVRTTVSALTQPLLLDTAQSPMRGQLDLDAVQTVEVVARLSRSGQPTAGPGDWEGSSAPLDRQQLPSTVPTITIDRPATP